MGDGYWRRNLKVYFHLPSQVLSPLLFSLFLLILCSSAGVCPVREEKKTRRKKITTQNVIVTSAIDISGVIFFFEKKKINLEYKYIHRGSISDIRNCLLGLPSSGSWARSWLAGRILSRLFDPAIRLMTSLPLIRAQGSAPKALVGGGPSRPRKSGGLLFC